MSFILFENNFLFILHLHTLFHLAVDQGIITLIYELVI